MEIYFRPHHQSSSQVHHGVTDLHGVGWGQTWHLAAPRASGAPRRSLRWLPISPLGAVRNGFWQKTVEFWSTIEFREKRPRNGCSAACSGAPPATPPRKGPRPPSLASWSAWRARVVAVGGDCVLRCGWRRLACASRPFFGRNGCG
jgi:hypothetical protein